MTEFKCPSEIEIRHGTLDEYRKIIWPLRDEIFGSPESFGALGNPYGIVRFEGSEIFEKTLFFPLIAVRYEEPIGAVLVYNLSCRTIRFNGIHVHPGYRQRGVGRLLLEYGLSLWPEPWNQVLALVRTHSVPAFSRWGFTLYDGQKPRSLSSSFFQVSEDRVLIMSRGFNSAHTGLKSHR